jgi:proteic killer suppression protein
VYGNGVHQDVRIAGFRNRELERFWRHDEVRGIARQHEAKLRAMLTAIEEAENVAELHTVPGWRLHPLKGDRRGIWSLKIIRNHRLTFRVEGSVVSEVDFEDYH